MHLWSTVWMNLEGEMPTVMLTMHCYCNGYGDVDENGGDGRDCVGAGDAADDGGLSIGDSDGGGNGVNVGEMMNDDDNDYMSA